jgi:NADPH-dependent ferric siderophore reductase
MATMAMNPPARVRREPPPFRRLTVRRVERLSARMMRVTFTGAELAGFVIGQPAASVRLLLPAPGSDELVMPRWTGNDYRLPDGRRATIRTFTPRRFDPEGLELDLDIVLHGDGVAPAWAEAAEVGNPAAVSGPARGYAVDSEAPEFVLAGDETAIPAIGQLLEHLPADTPVRAFIEVSSPDARLVLPRHDHATVEWLDRTADGVPGDRIVAAIADAELAPGSRMWAAGEAAAMQRIRRHLFEDRGLPRSAAFVRGYWKHGRAGDADDALT